jgi:hypothetical protein
VPEPVFTFNRKSLVLGRVLIGSLLLVDLGIRATALEAHYSDLGALPRDAYTLSQWDQAWSLHLLSGQVWFQALLFSCTALALLAWVVGWHTRVANAVAWLLYLSLCGRNPLLRDGQDELGRVLLFFCLFLPLDGARAPLTREAVQSAQVRSAGTVAFTVQVCLVYWSSVIHKLESPWWTRLQALHNVLQMRRYQTGLAQWLSGFPSLLEALTLASLLLEALGPVVLLVFWSRPRVRIAVVLSMIALHLGMWLNIRIGTFPPLCVATWLMFLPTAFWELDILEARWLRSRLTGQNEAGASNGGGLTEAPRDERWTRVALAPLVLVVLLMVQNVTHFGLGPVVNVPARTLGLQQWWGVFAPTPAEGHVSDGWLWAEGRTASGEMVTVDVPWFTSSPEPPNLLRFSDTRWRHLFANLTVVGWPAGSVQGKTQARAREATVRWMCRTWNREHPEQRLSQLYVFFFRHRLGEPAPVTRELLGSGDEGCAE